MRGRDRRSLWGHADFLKLWTAESISQLGSQVTLLALPLIALSLLGASTFQVGLLSTLEFAPFLLVGLPAGVWVDRLRRRPILVAADLGRALTLASIPVAWALGVLTIGQLYAVAFGAGVLTVFFDVAYQSYLPALVEPGQLVEGNGKLEVSRSGAQIAGPGVGGALIQLVGAPAAVLTDAASFLASALCIGLIRRGEPTPQGLPAARRVGAQPGDARRVGARRVGARSTGARSAGARSASARRGRMRADIAEGLRYVLRHPLLRPIALTTATSNLFAQIVQVALLVYMVRRLDFTAGTIGLVLAAGNVGFLLGAVLSGRLAAWLGLGPTIVGAIAASGLGALLLPLAPVGAPIPLLVAGWFAIAFGGVVYNVNQVSLRQTITPPTLLGRMNATMRFMVWGTIPVGSLVGGALGSAIGLRPTLWLGAVGGLLAVLPALGSGVRSLRRIQDAAPAPAGEPTAATAR